MQRPTVIVGNEEFLVARAVGRAVAAAKAGAGDLAEVVTVLAAEVDVDELRELTSPSLFGDERIVVIESVQDAGKDLAAFVLELIDSGRGDWIVMSHAGGAKGKAILDSLKNAGTQLVTIEPPKSARDKEQFVVDEVKAAGGSIDRQAATDLLTAVGGDLRELATVAAQLVADVGSRIGPEQVATYHRGRAELTGFVVADRAVEGQVGVALETVRWALSQGVDPVLISSSLAANLRLIGQVAGADRGTPEAVGAALRQPPWKIRRAQGWLRRWRPEALADAVAAVANADADLKGGGDSAAYAVERAVMAVASACAN